MLGLDNGQISAYNGAMRRKLGSLITIETSILQAGVELRRRGIEEFHGFLIAKEIGELTVARRLTAHGTLYKALGRMQQAGLLKSRWEDPAIAADESRPRRRLYQVTAAGESALADVLALPGQPVLKPKAGLRTT